MSIFYEEDIINEFKHTGSTRESARLVIDKTIDAMLGTDKELAAINKRIPRVEKMIEKAKKTLADFEKKSSSTQGAENMWKQLWHVFWAAFWFGLIGVGVQAVNDARKAHYIDKSYGESVSEFKKSDLEYAIKKSESALQTLKDRKKELEAGSKAKHETTSIFY
jgi:prefoldin subunit 5